MGRVNKYLTKNKPCHQLKNKLCKASLTKSGRNTTLTNPEPSTKKRPRNSLLILLETLDQVTISQMKHSTKSSRPSTRTDQVPLRRTKWLFSSSNSSETEHREQLLEAERTRNRSLC